jgi:pSer/pThr/pTyr-binding forkhead associated (FHA) protein
MNELFAKLKRLFEPRPRPTEPIGEATADRPPPKTAEPPRAEAARTPPPPAEPAPVAAPPIEEAPPIETAPSFEAPPSRPAASVDVDELAEVRAALEAVAQDPVAATEPTAEVLPAAPEPQAPPSVVPQAPAPDAVGDSLVLTLATPPTAFTVAKASATLGRGQENTIRLDDLSVSRRHARIAYRQGGYWLSDLGSMGGTWVDGTRLNAPRRITAGDVIDIGLCRLTVSFVGGAKSEPKKSASKPPSEVTAQVKRRR